MNCTTHCHARDARTHRPCTSWEEVAGRDWEAEEEVRGWVAGMLSEGGRHCITRVHAHAQEVTHILTLQLVLDGCSNQNGAQHISPQPGRLHGDLVVACG